MNIKAYIRIAILGLLLVIIALPTLGSNITIQDLLDEVNHINLMNRVEHLEGYGTRFTGSVQAPLVRDYIYDELIGMGWQVIIQEFPLEEPIFGQTVSWNVIARRAGSTPDARVIIGAHWDSIDENEGGSWVDPENPAPGALDNATGVAVLLEIASITRNIPFMQDVEIVFFGSEETGIQGSKFYVDCLVQAGVNVAGFFNVDSVGYDMDDPDDFAIFYDNSSGWIKNKVVQWASQYTTLTPNPQFAPAAASNSDVHYFWQAYLPAVSLWEGTDHGPYYNHAQDTITENMLRWTTNTSFFEEMGRMALVCLLKWGVWFEGAVGIEDVPFNVNCGLEIYPNPFRKSTTISFAAGNGPVDAVEIFDIRGRRVRNLKVGLAGVAWDGDNDNGDRMPSGVYLVRPAGSKSAQAKRVILAR
ncbi:MAG: M28 family peptidase [bacterium]|nr:M28 family peptidase [bacterium]